MTRFSLVAAGLWAMILLAPKVAAAEAQPGANPGGAPAAEFRCMAIVANAGLAKSGFADLVGNELQQAGIALVEREQLNKVIQEQSLALAVGSDAAGQRVELGRLVRADALVLLEDEGANDQRMIRIVIAECGQGARLLSERIHFDKDIAVMAQKVAARVIQTRAHFSGGIKGIIAVTPFIARNFTYEYHRLQQGYAVTLREALGALRGVAVLDVEEALAIRKELQLAGANAAGVVPLFVDGEFEVSGSADQPRVRFSIVLRSAAGARTINRENLTLEEASKFLSRDMAGEIMPAYRDAADRPFTPAEEFIKLVSRADQFALLGEWRHAADLRQAALAIQPRDVRQREKLYRECIGHIGSLIVSPYSRRPGPRWEEATRGADGYYATALELLEWKIRQHHDHPGGDPVGAGDANCIFLLAGSSAARAAQPAKRDFLLHVYPLTWEESWSNATDAREVELRFYWVDTLISIVLDCGGVPPGREDYDLLQHLVDDVVPPGIPPSHRLTGLLWGESGAFGRSSPEFLDFLGRFKKSKNPMYQLLAREAYLTWQVTHRAALTPDLPREEQDIRREYLALNLPNIGGQSAGVIEQLDWLKEQLSKPPDASGRIAAGRLPAGIVGAPQNFIHFPGERNLVVPDSPPAAVDVGALHFENLMMQRKLPSGKFVPPKSLQDDPPANLTQCGNQADILWGEARIGIMLMRPPCVLEPLALQMAPVPSAVEVPVPGAVEVPVPSAVEAPQSRTLAVAWDGQHVWMAATGEGLFAMDVNGKVLARIGEAEGLPPCDQGVAIAVLGPGRLIVIGSFGPTRRAFIAKIEKTGDRYRADTFFKATRPMPEAGVGSFDADIDFGFIPTTIARCPSPAGGDYLVVRRYFTTRGAVMHPLIVDLKTLSVCVSKSAIEQYPFLQVEGGLLQSMRHDEGLILWHVTQDGKDLVTDFAPLRLPSNRRDPVLAATGTPTWTVGPDGKVYQPGYDWYRIDPRTMTACCLAKDGPPALSMYHISESRAGMVWWGMVGARQFGMYRVVVDEEKVKGLPASEFYHAERIK